MASYALVNNTIREDTITWQYSIGETYATHKKKLKINKTKAKFHTMAIFSSADLQLGLSMVSIRLFSLTRQTIVTATVI